MVLVSTDGALVSVSVDSEVDMMGEQTEVTFFFPEQTRTNECCDVFAGVGNVVGAICTAVDRDVGKM